MPGESQKSTNPLLATVLAWLIPGAGHFYLGRRVRGVVIFLTIGAAFWGGVAMGGVLTMDCYYSSSSRWWFLAQMFTGVHGIYGWQAQKRVYDKIIPRLPDAVVTSNTPNNPERFINLNGKTVFSDDLDFELQKQGLALAYMPTENAARAYAGVAGMLNLLCIVDALMLSLMGVYGEPKPPLAVPKEGT